MTRNSPVSNVFPFFELSSSLLRAKQTLSSCHLFAWMDRMPFFQQQPEQYFRTNTVKLRVAISPNPVTRLISSQDERPKCTSILFTRGITSSY